MRALVIEKPGSALLDDVPVPQAEGEKVLVQVLQAGICGSDVEILNGTRPADFVRYPVVPGHEWVGEVAAVGEGVRDLPRGTRVVGENFRPCFRCPRCAEGKTNLCSADYQEAGFTQPGAFAQYLCVERKFLHVLPKSVPVTAGALIEPAACVAEGLLELGVRPASSCAVVGAGTLGILALQLLRLSSPARLLAVDRRRDRLDAVREISGADVELADPEESGFESQFDVVIVTADSAHAAATAIKLARRGGDLLYEGISGDPIATVSPDSIVLKHLRVQGIFGASRAAWSSAVDVVSSGLLRAEGLVTHQLSLDQHEHAFKLLQDAAPGTLKVQFSM